ncbi:family 20 glycosylhydrolase [Parapedobacter koreensis]|uniref:beta-N-acetylhexosaminidase n=1 Tax=Parapedobacter koreensis TaxID=332977 RepID=A0A1H7S556_9SPHI|nr:family 20 glycosylhydrolase [Parapedobacter koreensis]SEL67643.1 hexosaminidase [Parapedobacter koreensis]
MKTNAPIILFIFTVIFFGCTTKERAQHGLTYNVEIRTDASQQLVPVCYVSFHLSREHDLNKKNWKLYFNSYKKPQVDSTDADQFNIVHVNGDLNYIEPTAHFSLQQDADSLTIPIRQARLRNISDFPTGFYLVYDDKPDQYYPFINENPLYDHIVLPENALAEEIYESNQRLAANIPIKPEDQLLPSPKAIKSNEQYYTLTDGLYIIADNPFMGQASYLIDEIKKYTNLNLHVISDPTKGGIKLKYWNLEEEAYQLRIENTGIEITAGTASGMFYGIQTLKRLILDHYRDGKCVLPGLEVDDKPRFKHRSVMLDVARNYLPKEKLLEVLDMMAAYKINTLHFHFNDDEGWRLAIPGLPELTDFGGYRGHTTAQQDYLPPSHGSGPDSASTRGSGFYTRKDFIDILTYAKDRFITVIPELETPGHARAAIKSMEHRYRKYLNSDTSKAMEYLLNDVGDQSVYRTVQGWNDDAINPALESSYHFVEKVITELALMYQDAGAELRIIHMGGDEVPAGVWERSAAVRRFLADNRSFDTADDLWEYFYGRVGGILAKKDIRMQGWEEIGMKRIDVNGRKKMEIVPALRKNGYLLDVWNNVYGTGAEDLAYRLANQGFDIVLSNVTHMYLDLASTRSFYEPGMYWGGYVSPEKIFGFVPENYYRTFLRDDMDHPIDSASLRDKIRLNSEGLKHINGLQCALWSETLINKDNFDYMLYPKLIAFAERAWAPQPAWATAPNEAFETQYNDAWSRFNAILWHDELPRFDRYWKAILYRIPAPGIKIDNNHIHANTESEALTIHYTVNGGIPSITDKEVKGPLKEKGIYRFKAFHKKTARSSRMIVVNNL